MSGGATRPRSSDASPADVTRAGSWECDSKVMLRKVGEIPAVARVLSRADPLPQQQTLREYIERVLGNYDQYFARQPSNRHLVNYNEGMRLAAIISCIARELARELNDPYLGPVLAKELLRVYRAAFEEVLGEAKAVQSVVKNEARRPIQEHTERGCDTDHMITLAQSIVGADPVTLYLQQKIKLEKAAAEIRGLAASCGKNAGRLCAQLVEQFQIRIGAFDGNKVRDREADDIVRDEPLSGTQRVTKSSFTLEDLYGEVSVRFFRDTVNLDTNGMPKWRKGVGCLTKSARDKLKLLRAEVNDPQLVPFALSDQELDAERLRSSPTLSVNQLAHFVKLRSSEERELLTKYEDNPNYDMDQEGIEFREQSKGKTPEEYVLTQIARRYDVDSTKAASIKNAIIYQLRNIPLTISCDVSTMFRQRADNRALPFHGAQYMNRQVLAVHEHRLRDIFQDPAIPEGRTVASIGNAGQDYVKGRGINYMRWRREKDERETGFRGLGPRDLPVFGAMNPNFDKINRGDSSRRKCDEETRQYTEEERSHGVNYYGDVHFILKDELRSRSMFIARGANHLKRFRIERLDLLLLLADMFRLSMHEYLDAMVAAAHGDPEAFVTHMEGEVHVYGGLDLTADVKEVYVPSEVFNATDGPGKRLMTFAEDHGIAVKDIGPKPVRFKAHPGPIGARGRR